MNALETFNISHDGHDFRVSIYPDDSGDAPWERAEGHGSVRQIPDRETMARGESFLAYGSHRGYRWVYDVSGAILQASREGWGLPPEDLQRLTDKLGKKPTKSQIRMAAIRADMDFLRGYVRGDWSYIGVCVQRLDDDGEPKGDKYAHAVWGVESCSQSYIEETAAEIAAEILHSEGLDSDTQALCMAIAAPMQTIQPGA